MNVSNKFIVHLRGCKNFGALKSC